MNVAMELINVNKNIGKKHIIKDLNLSIHKGEVFGLLGPNGAGKTTTIRMMVGLMKMTSGDIQIEGHSIRKDYKNAVRHVGAIVENPEMYPFLSGWKNLKHYARMIPGITDERIHEVIQLVGLQKAIKEKAGRYSLGMRQRLGVAQALLHRPSILILDEPTNGLDPAGIREIRQYIRKLAEEEDVSVIVSSHLLSEIELMCDRIGIIKNGELLSVEDVKDSQDDEENTELSVTLNVSPLKEAMEIVSSFPIKSEGEHSITVKATREQIPDIIKSLVQADIQIYEVNVEKTSLEDKFFERIGENTIA
ncbi:ABC-2 type transport system ATP-binding protein [Gracilibacillus halotolerans]|uniref:ABC-2 type transport system ATP-binding protein n=2 Tax=Gracilibacillus halotolerans TaxID=74386 RepID=A0A841RPQ0_9BACI|nr:ABC-2 type transport system ATP-binding protein [Gracilibacillus halotolerans]